MNEEAILFDENEAFDLGTASCKSGVRFMDLLQLCQLEKMHSVFIQGKYYVSKSTLETLKLHHKGVNILRLFDNQ